MKPSSKLFGNGDMFIENTCKIQNTSSFRSWVINMVMLCIWASVNVLYSASIKNNRGSSSASVTPDMRKEMGDMAVRLPKPLAIIQQERLNLLWTKTVPTILWKMNTCIQVEHPDRKW